MTSGTVTEAWVPVTVSRTFDVGSTHDPAAGNCLTTVPIGSEPDVYVNPGVALSREGGTCSGIGRRAVQESRGLASA